MAYKFQDMSSETDIECSQNEKELLDYILDKYRNRVFELFNITARKLDQIKRQKDLVKKLQFRGIRQDNKKEEKEQDR